MLVASPSGALAIAPRRFWRRGMGDVSQGTKDMQAAGAGLLAAAPLTGPAAPFVAAAGVILEGLAAVGVGSGCGVDCIKATSIVNQAEPVLQKNVDDYENGRIDQATAQTAFQQVWLAVSTACGAVPGGAGQRCVTDRQRGACTWKQNAPPKYPGQPAEGECFDWETAYFDPLQLPPINAPASSAFSSSTGAIDWSKILLFGGAGLLLAEVVG